MSFAAVLEGVVHGPLTSRHGSLNHGNVDKYGHRSIVACCRASTVNNAETLPYLHVNKRDKQKSGMIGIVKLINHLGKVKIAHTPTPDPWPTLQGADRHAGIMHLDGTNRGVIISIPVTLHQISAQSNRLVHRRVDAQRGARQSSGPIFPFQGTTISALPNPAMKDEGDLVYPCGCALRTNQLR